METDHLDDLHFGVDAKVVEKRLQVLLHLYAVVFDLCASVPRISSDYTNSLTKCYFIVPVIVIIIKTKKRKKEKKKKKQ